MRSGRRIPLSTLRFANLRFQSSSRAIDLGFRRAAMRANH